jgi:hypothetical protein
MLNYLSSDNAKFYLTLSVDIQNYLNEYCEYSLIPDPNNTFFEEIISHLREVITENQSDDVSYEMKVRDAMHDLFHDGSPQKQCRTDLSFFEAALAHDVPNRKMVNLSSYLDPHTKSQWQKLNRVIMVSYVLTPIALVCLMAFPNFNTKFGLIKDYILFLVCAPLSLSTVLQMSVIIKCTLYNSFFVYVQFFFSLRTILSGFISSFVAALYHSASEYGNFHTYGHFEISDLYLGIKWFLFLHCFPLFIFGLRAMVTVRDISKEKIKHFIN